MLNLADLVIRFRWWVIGLSLLLTGFLGWKTMSVSLNADFSTYLSQENPAVKEYNRIGDMFGGSDIGVVLVSTDEVFVPPTLRLIDDLTGAFEEVEGISYVTSLTNVIDFRETDWGLEVGTLVDGETISAEDSQLADLRNYVLGNERYVGNLITGDGRTAAILLQFEGGGLAGSNQFFTSLRIREATESILAAFDGEEEHKLYYGGLPFLVYNMTLLIGENLSTLIPLMIFLLVLILYMGFRHWAGVLFPLIVVTISVIWVTGIMGLFGLEFDLLTGIMPVVLLALGSADGIHLMKRYYESRKEGSDSGQATRATFRQMGMPILLTTVTTTVGFASLFVSDFTVIRQFGLLTAAGVILALIVTLTLLPALLSFGIGFQPKVSSGSSTGRFSDRFGYWVFKRGKAILAGSLALITVAVIAIPRIEKDVDWSLCLAQGSDPYHAEMMLREQFEGSLPALVVVNGNIRDPALLQLMQRVGRRLDTVPEVGKPVSMGSILAEMNDVLNGRYRPPEELRGVSNLWLLIEDEEQMDQIVTPDSETGLIQAKIGTWHTGTLVATVDSIDAYLETLPEQISVVDLDRLDSGSLRRVMRYRLDRMMEELGWLLQEEGVERTEELLDEVRNSLLNFRIDGQVAERVLDEVDRYLASSQAEVSFGEMHRVTILELLGQELTNRGGRLTAENISDILVSADPGLGRAVADWLAGSLAVIIESEIGEMRLRGPLELISQEAPGNDENFRKHARGILWGVNGRIAFLDARFSEDLLGDNPAILREVPVTLHQAGMPEVLKGMEEELVPTQIRSLLTAMLFVLILLAVIFRSTLVAGIAIVPISLTILINFGVMGYLGIGLDSFTAMIASIAIGLGIDTDIHFISRYRDELLASRDKLRALQVTIRTTGMSILINALAVGLGFLVLLFAGGQHIRRFGGLTSLTVLVSATLSLTLLAVLIVWLKPQYLIGKEAEETKFKTEERRSHEMA